MKLMLADPEMTVLGLVKTSLRRRPTTHQFAIAMCYQDAIEAYSALERSSCLGYLSEDREALAEEIVSIGALWRMLKDTPLAGSAVVDLVRESVGNHIFDEQASALIEAGASDAKVATDREVPPPQMGFSNACT